MIIIIYSIQKGGAAMFDEEEKNGKRGRPKIFKNSTHLTLTIRTDVFEKLRKAAKEKERSMSNLANILLESALNEQD
jgi:hypothetical protein